MRKLFLALGLFGALAPLAGCAVYTRGYGHHYYGRGYYHHRHWR